MANLVRNRLHPQIALAAFKSFEFLPDCCSRFRSGLRPAMARQDCREPVGVAIAGAGAGL